MKYIVFLRLCCAITLGVYLQGYVVPAPKPAHLTEVSSAYHLQDVEVFSFNPRPFHLPYQRFSCDWRKVQKPFDLSHIIFTVGI